jgi:hypothetical protein
MTSPSSRFWKGFELFYALYAGVVIWLLWRHQASSPAERFAVNGMLALWCVALIAVLLKLPGARWMALAAVLPVIGMLLFISSLRIAFIWNHGGMDCGTCDGSPLAFLVDWIFEAALLAPAIFICVWLRRTKRRGVLDAG